MGQRAPDTEVMRARAVIKKPIARWTLMSEVDRKRKIHQYLAARGFSYDVIEEVIERPASED
jgi:SOS response regulatory protein OraA/RecX